MCEIRENAMQKKQFQQNMKDKVRVFEDGGIRLLKRGQKGVVHAIFSRFGLVLVLLLLQAFALFSLLQWFGELPHYFGGTLLVTAAMMVYLLNQDMDNSVRITWLVVTALMPVLGVPLFWYTKSDVGHNALKRRLLDLEGRTRAQLPQNEQTVELLQEQAPEAVPLARYLRGKGGGYKLTKSPDQYTVGAILRLTEDSLAPVSCLGPGAAVCARAAECRTLHMWQGLDKVINEYLDNVTIADLMKSGAAGDNYVI